MTKKRLDFTKKYRNWTVEEKKVMFSNENTFNCFRGTPERVCHPSNISHFHPNYTVRTVNHPDQVMMWGCFSGDVGRDLVLP